MAPVKVTLMLILKRGFYRVAAGAVVWVNRENGSRLDRLVNYWVLSLHPYLSLFLSLSLSQPL